MRFRSPGSRRQPFQATALLTGENDRGQVGFLAGGQGTKGVQHGIARTLGGLASAGHAPDSVGHAEDEPRLVQYEPVLVCPCAPARCP